EGCASILWKSADKKQAAAEALNLTAEGLLGLGLVDEVLPEPLGGAHRDPPAMSRTLQESLLKNVRELQAADLKTLMSQRAARTAAFGVYSETSAGGPAGRRAPRRPRPPCPTPSCPTRCPPIR